MGRIKPKENNIIGRYGSGAGETDDIRIDASTNSLQTIEYEHHEIHSGSSFTCNYEQTVSDTDDRSIVCFKTPNTTKYAHITISASASAPAVAIMTEAPTVTDNTGDSLTIYNRNRTGTPPASTVLDTSQNPDLAGSATFFTETTMTNVTGGTELAIITLKAGAGPKAIGGAARAQQEWVLAADTQYCFEVKSLDDDDNTHRIELDWYEHTDKH